MSKKDYSYLSMEKVLAVTKDHLVEFGYGFLTISRYIDGHCLSFEGRLIATQFKNTLNEMSAESTIDRFIKLSNGRSWEPLYNPKEMPRAKPEDLFL